MRKTKSLKSKRLEAIKKWQTGDRKGANELWQKIHEDRIKIREEKRQRRLEKKTSR